MTTPTDGALAASAHARCEARYQVQATARRHRIAADEPEAAGGSDTAPTPLELLASGLAACTAITLRMYAERKGWVLGTVQVDCRAFTSGGGYRFERAIRIEAPLGDDQRARLGEIAEKTPVTRIVKAGAAVVTTVA